MSKCSICGKKINFFDSYSDFNGIYCSKCFHSMLKRKTIKQQTIKQSEIKDEKQIDYNKTGTVLGVVGFVFFPLVFGILALIFGAISQGKDNKNMSAIILGFIDILWYFISLSIGSSLF